jgi:hypothetical protein
MIVRVFTGEDQALSWLQQQARDAISGAQHE